ncbi:putative tail protein [Flavobacterium phage FL-1]|nr:putative tail protein [Flavobacterium phage FL-1]
MATATISTAVGLDRISRVSGYDIKKGFFNTETQNLPQIIAVFGEANTANQSGLTTDKVEVTSAAEAASLWGYGSPLHRVISILRPAGSDGVGGIPTVVFPQVSSGGATATVRAWTVTGTATANATHKVIINGRDSVDYQYYTYDIAIGDTPTVIAAKIATAISGVLGAPCTAASALGVVTGTTKWKGLSSKDFNMTIDYGVNAAGLSYSQTTSTDGAGSVDLSASLSQFGDDWYTIVVNTYGEAQLGALEAFNGVPSDVNPTGRWNGLVFKPFCAYFGNTSGDRTVLSTITDASDKINQVTNVLCPAPNSKGFPFEAAANVVLLAALVYQNTPHLDVSGLSYPDMPIPSDGNIGTMNDYNNRDYLVKRGCSTVMLVEGQYQIQDLVTTYHPAGEVPLLYNYVRTLNIHWNVKDAYVTLEKVNLKDKTIVRDDQFVEVDNVIKPREWKGIASGLFEDLAQAALINDPQFSKSGLRVQISATNPNRFETAFPYKTTATVRISSTTATAGF